MGSASILATAIRGRVHARPGPTSTLPPAWHGPLKGARSARNLSEPLTGPRQTNNRAELTAILRALDLAPRNVEVCIFTDSEYSIKCLTVWFQTWRRNNWVASNGRSVENRDLIEAILSRIEERLAAAAKTNFQWLRGHANHHGNVQADHLAVLGAQRARS